MKFWVVEGNRMWIDGGAMFGNSPKPLWNRWVETDDQNRILLACRCLLIQTDDGRHFLFETGVGTFFEPKLRERYGIEGTEHVLLENLAQIGLSDTDIDGVILSHLHFDHVGGLLSAYDGSPPRLLFPNASFYVGRTHWEAATKPNRRERASFLPNLHALLQDSGRLRWIDTPAHPDLDFGITFHRADGHTKGMILSVLEYKDRPFIFVADLIPGRPWVHLPITMGYDRFAELAVVEKQRLYDTYLESEPYFFFVHDPEVAVGQLQQPSPGKYSCSAIDLS